jgi:hypothetical protein
MHTDCPFYFFNFTRIESYLIGTFLFEIMHLMIINHGIEKRGNKRLYFPLQL